MRWLKLTSLLLIVLLASGCIASGEKHESEKTQSGTQSVGSTSGVAQGETAFALDIYRHLAGEDKNVFLSPFSIHTVLSMAYEGARGKTAKEMARVLHEASRD